MLASLALALALQAPPELSVAELLAHAVDLPTPKERASAARTLARRRDVTLEHWLAAMRDFEPSHTGEASGTGAFVETIDLAFGRTTRATELQVYVPEGYDKEAPAPLLCAFHGTRGSGRGLHRMWRGVADELGMLVLAPTDAGENEGYRFSEEEREAALEALRWMRRHFNVDEDRILLTGISRGAHLAWDLALRHPDRFAAIAPMIGGPRAQLRRGQNNMRYLENVAHLSIRDLQGALDDPGLVANLRLAFEKLWRFGAKDAKLVEFPELGHSFELAVVDWNEFYGSARRAPAPSRVVLHATRAPARAFGLVLTRLDKGVDEEFKPKVDASTWNRLDEAGRRAWLVDEADDRTARAELRKVRAGRFVVTGDKVRAVRLLLTQADLDPDGTVEVDFGKATVKKKPKPSAGLLLAEFVERFDRRFLPAYEVEVRER